MAGDAIESDSSTFWTRTRNVPMVFGGVTVMVALLPFVVGDGPVARFAPVGLVGALIACWLAWRHRKLVSQSAPLGALRMSWTTLFLLSAGVFAASGWIADRRWGWAQLLFCLAMATMAWTPTSNDR